MVKMIPSYVSSDMKSNAERKVFELFKNLEGYEDWIVMHSLGLSKHEKLLMGEIDFLVLAPKFGVFAIEVKGGRIACNGGVWEFTNRYGETSRKSRSPFSQASEGMYSVRKFIEERTRGEYDRLLFGHGVIFPDIEFDFRSIEFERWQYCDRGDIGNGIDLFIKNLSKHNAEKWRETYKNWTSEKYPSVRQVNKMGALLRGDFDRPIMSSTLYEEIEESIFRLTEEQFRVLDAAEDNARIVCTGPAGTGKTLLAIKETVRAASKGSRVALFCYNKVLGEYLQEHSDLMNENIVFVGTIHKYMSDLARKSGVDLDYDDPAVYSDLLPEKCIQLLDGLPVFDKIIIDEAQDVISDSYLLFLDSILKNGFSRGKWVLLGDFENQKLYGGNEKADLIETISDYSSGHVGLRLKTNCRNTKNIGLGLELLSGVTIEKYLDKTIDGPDIEYHSDNEGTLQEKITGVLDGLIADGVHPRNITILSPRRFEKSNTIRLISDRVMNGNASSSESQIMFSTIHSYKGMDNQVILLVDINSYADKSITYVGFSRARIKLHVFESVEARRQRLELLLSKKGG